MSCNRPIKNKPIHGGEMVQLIDRQSDTLYECGSDSLRPKLNTVLHVMRMHTSLRIRSTYTRTRWHFVSDTCGIDLSNNKLLKQWKSLAENEWEKKSQKWMRFFFFSIVDFLLNLLSRLLFFELIGNIWIHGICLMMSSIISNCVRWIKKKPDLTPGIGLTANESKVVVH